VPAALGLEAGLLNPSFYSPVSIIGPTSLNLLRIGWRIM
jgi:hypothetical protein